jgi:hypothetical protein
LAPVSTNDASRAFSGTVAFAGKRRSAPGEYGWKSSTGALLRPDASVDADIVRRRTGNAYACVVGFLSAM